MKKNIQRADVAKLLVSDEYYEKKHVWLKIRQTLIALLGWIGVVVPFIWILAPFLFKEIANKFQLFTYTEEIQMFLFIGLFLVLAFLFILVLYIWLTILNNYRFKHLLQKENQYDEKLVEKRRQLLEEDFSKRFGPKEERRALNYYSVKEEQNLEKDYVQNLFKKGGADL